MLLFHLLTYDPAWKRAKTAKATEVIFYDGSCGLCHRVVRFVLSEDKAQRFHFSTIGSDYFNAVFDSATQDTLPDSFILLNDKGDYKVEGAAVIELLVKLGGLWAVVGKLLNWLPIKMTNTLYRFIGARRYRLFETPENVCPIISDKRENSAIMSRFC